MDITCDLNCPPICRPESGIGYCCQGCAKTNKGFLDSDKWDDAKGFLGEDGCKLSRDEMPERCREYNCRDEIFYRFYFTFAPIVWDGEKWAFLPYIEHFIEGNWKGNEALFGSIKRDIEKGFSCLTTPKS